MVFSAAGGVTGVVTGGVTLLCPSSQTSTKGEKPPGVTSKLRPFSVFRTGTLSTLGQLAMTSSVRSCTLRCSPAKCSSVKEVCSSVPSG